MLMGVGLSTFVNYNTARKWGQHKEKAYKMKELRIDNKYINRKRERKGNRNKEIGKEKK